MSKKYDFIDYTIEEKQRRLRVQQKADEIRLKWARKGQFDIFEILENESILIRKPLETKAFSGFTTYFEENFVIFLNSSYTLGHERFSAAHELGHLVLHHDKLLKERLLAKEELTEKEANLFAVEFLMPADGVKEIFYKIIVTEPNKIKAKHVIKMHNYFKVSYKAMLKRLVFLELCNLDLYEELCDYCSIDNAELLQELTRKEGYDCSLIKVSNAYHVSVEYEEIIKRNYESGKISYKRLLFLLEFIGKTPSDYGYEVSEDDY